MIKPPPFLAPLNNGGTLQKPWHDWFSNLYRTLLVTTELPPYSVATVPNPAQHRGGMIYITNEAGGPVPAFSDGTNWRRVTDRAIIS